jgi:diguanylate cyclase (GGDEF)-like protein
MTTALVGRGIRRPGGWKLWTVPRRLIVYMLAVEAFTVVVTGIGLSRGRFDLGDVGVFLLVVGFGLTTAEATRHVERMRRRFSDTPHVNMSSVWTLAAALLLPPPLAATAAIVLYLHLWLRSWYRVRGVHSYRLVFTTSTVILACYGSAAAMRAIAPDALRDLRELDSMLAFGVAVAVYSAINSGLVAAAIGLLDGRITPSRMLGSARENAVEFATLGLGLGTAVFVVIQPVLVLAELPALMLLHRCVLLRQLEEAAATDHRTGLLNATAWNGLASAELARAGRDGTTLGVLMVDLDHFKRINDAHGRELGDRVLQLVAGTLRETVRPYDMVGCFGGEEFVILCTELTADDLVAVGERLCQQVRALRVPLTAQDDPSIADLAVSVSVGAAHYPTSGPDLDDLLRDADAALFAAKDAGRDRVEAVMDSAIAFMEDDV